VRGYYNDMGGNRGNCSYGIGILAHRGACTEEELQRPLTTTVGRRRVVAQLTISVLLVRTVFILP
jgi:hypothetical protein